MKSLTERRQCADEDKRSPLPNPGSPQHFQSESVVVVLGVMYPSALPQLVKANTHLDLIPLPPDSVTGRQSVDVVFYDPLSSSKNGEEVPQTAKYERSSKGDGHVHRTEAQKTVARDLAFDRKTQLATTFSDCHHFRIPEPP